jgi:hypothetical protein
MSYVFDGDTKIISLTLGTVTIDVVDLWSRWLDWLLLSDNSKYPIAMKQVGTEPIDPVAGTFIPIYIFLQNGWRLRPQEASHTLKVTNGILLVDGGGDPFLNTLGSFNVRINYQQPVQAITVSTTSGGSGSGATPAEVWEYGSRTLTDDRLNTIGTSLNEIKGTGFDTNVHSLVKIKARFQAVINAILGN